MRTGTVSVLLLLAGVLTLAPTWVHPNRVYAAGAPVRLDSTLSAKGIMPARLGDLIGLEVQERFSPLLTQTAPLENQLSAGTTGLLRTIRKRIRQVARTLRTGAGQWSTWLGGGLLFLVVGLVVPVLGRDNLRTFRQEGFVAFMRELSLAIAVYVRLLIDSRTPMVGKALLAFSVAYGASAVDIFPDRGWQSYIDDLILIMLASRSFMLLCPESIVEEHALAAAQAREQNLQKKLGRRRRTAKDVGGATPAATGSQH